MTDETKALSAYEERDRLVALLSAMFPSSLEVDDGGEPGWRWVVFVQFPWGQASWHIADGERHLFGHLVAGAGISRWDGHTTDEKYADIKAAVKVIGTLSRMGDERSLERAITAANGGRE